MCLIPGGVGVGGVLCSHQPTTRLQGNTHTLVQVLNITRLKVFQCDLSISPAPYCPKLMTGQTAVPDFAFGPRVIQQRQFIGETDTRSAHSGSQITPFILPRPQTGQKTFVNERVYSTPDKQSGALLR